MDVVKSKTFADGFTPVCNACGVHLCWDIGPDEYAKSWQFWTRWCCESCNGGQDMNSKSFTAPGKIQNPLPYESCKDALLAIDAIETGILEHIFDQPKAQLTPQQIVLGRKDIDSLARVMSCDIGSLISIEQTLLTDHMGKLMAGLSTKVSSLYPIVWLIHDKQIITDGNHRTAYELIRGNSVIDCAVMCARDIVRAFGLKNIPI